MSAEINSNSPENTADSVTLKELFSLIKDWSKYLITKWLIILCVGLSGGLAGFFYAASKKPIYTASTTFVLEDEKASAGLGSLAGLASIAGVDLGGGGGIFQGDNILELYKSRKMIEQTLFKKVSYEGKSILLVERYIAFNQLREKWAEKKEMLGLSFDALDLKRGNNDSDKKTRLRDSVLGTIVNDISKNYLNVSKPDKKLSIIKAEVKSKDEFFSKKFDEEIVKNVNDFYIQTRVKKSSINIKVLEEKIDSVRRIMNHNIYNAIAVSDATPNLNPTRQVQRVVPVQRSQISVETNKAILSTLIQNLEVAKYTQAKEVPLIQIVDSPIFPLEVQRLGKLKGIVFGGLLFGFLIVLFFTTRKVIVDNG